MSKLERFTRSTIVYFVGNVLTKLISFFLLPLFTAHIAKEALGYYDTSTNIISFLAMTVFLSLWSAILRQMYDYDTDRGKYRAINNGLVLLSLCGVVYFSIILVFNAIIIIDYIWYITLFGIFTILHYLYGNIVRGFGYNILYVVSGLITSIANFIISYILIINYNFGIEAMYISVTFGYLLQIIIIEAKLRIIANFSAADIDLEVIKQYIRFSFPLAVSTLLHWLLEGYNKFFIARELGLAANGLFSIAARFSSLLFLVSSCVILAWQELAFYSAGQESSDSKAVTYNKAISGYVYYMVLILGVFIVGISIVFPFFINDAYREAYGLIPIHFIATAFSTFMNFFSQSFFADRKSSKVMISYFVAAVVNVLLISILVDQFGIQGASLSMLISYLIGIMILFSFAKQFMRLKDLSKKIFPAFLLLFLGIFVFFQNSLIISLIYLLLSFLMIGFVERKMISNMIVSIKNRSRT